MNRTFELFKNNLGSEGKEQAFSNPQEEIRHLRDKVALLTHKNVELGMEVDRIKGKFIVELRELRSENEQLKRKLTYFETRIA